MVAKFGFDAAENEPSKTREIWANLAEVHSRWLFHGSAAVDSIVEDPVTGFRPLLSSSAIWGRGVYFARDCLYVHDHGYAREIRPGVRQVLLDSYSLVEVKPLSSAK